MVMWLDGLFDTDNVKTHRFVRPIELDEDLFVRGPVTRPFAIHVDDWSDDVDEKTKRDLEKDRKRGALDMDDLVIFNEFWTKMLALHSGDNENIKAILAEINKFRDFAKKANEINAVVRQLDGFEGAEIKISLGMNGSIHWPADELINKTNAMMSDAVLNLKRQEMVLQRMADAIEGDQLVDGLNLDLITFDGAIPKDDVKLNRGIMVSFNPDTWLEEWQRDVSEFCGIYGIKARFAGIIRRQGAKWHKELLAKGEVRVWNEVRGERFILKYLPKFREALPDIITGEIQIRQIGTTARHDLKKALEKTR